MRTTAVWGIVFFVAAFMPLVPVSAQNGTPTPDPLDFGLVEMGDSLTLPLTLTSDGRDSSIIVQEAFLLDDGGGVFVITDIVCSAMQWPGFDIPVIMPPGDTLVVDIAYSPDALGFHAGMLRFVSNDHDTPILDVPLYGQSVPTVPVPSAVCLLSAGLVGIVRLRKRLHV